MKSRVSCLALAGVLTLPAFAQYGRSYPGMPGGRTGTSLPPAVPGAGKAGKPAKDKKEKPAEEPLATFTGSVKRANSKSLTIEGSDSNTTDFVCTRKTTFYDGSKKVKASALKPGDRVSVEAAHGLDGALEAVNVHIERQKT